MSIEVELKMFINAIVTGWSSERRSVGSIGQESRPYGKIGVHFIMTINVQMLPAKHDDQDDRKL